MHLYEVLRQPLITEKNTNLQTLNKYAFAIADKATKPQIKQAVEKSFKVKVNKVNVLTMPGKTRRVGKQLTQTRSWKKAIVTLKPGDKIEFFEGV